MVPKTCSFNECPKSVLAKGYCNGHWKQQHAGLDLIPLVGRSLSPEQRFWAKVEKTVACWNWTGRVSVYGYGQLRSSGTMQAAHRVSYAMHKGPIPDGLHVDHMCHNRACVNPEHLRAVTPKQNNENLIGARRGSVSGVRGVYWNKRLKRWSASVRHNGQRYYLGLFDDLNEADAAAIAKRNELFTHNNLDRIAK